MAWRYNTSRCDLNIFAEWEIFGTAKLNPKWLGVGPDGSCSSSGSFRSAAPGNVTSHITMRSSHQNSSAALPKVHFFVALGIGSSVWHCYLLQVRSLALQECSARTKELIPPSFR